MNRSVPGLFVVLLVLAACAAPPGGSPPGSDPSSPGASSEPRASDDGGGSGEIEHPTGADEAILVITQAGGMIPVQMQVGQTPVFVLTGDGRVIVQGFQTLEFPGPILPPLQERTLTEEGIQTILRVLDDTNLFVGELENRVMQAMVADAPDTAITVNAGGRTATVTVYAIGMLLDGMEPPPGADPEELEAYRVLSALNDRLMTLDTWLPAAAWATDEWRPYVADAFRLYVRDVSEQPVDEQLPPQQRPWPTDEDPAAFGTELESFGDGTRCGVAEGEAAATWAAELALARQNTIWTSGERRYAITVRPLLPHEAATCPELDG